MANEKTINARLQQKHDIKAHWELATKFIPKAGEIIVYDDLNKIKIGDGTTYVNTLPFVNGSVGEKHINENGEVKGEIFNDYETNQAAGLYSHAEGQETTAGGEGAHAEGAYTHASGAYSHAEGTHTYATKANAHAEGESTSAEGEAAHAEGLYTSAAGEAAHAEGVYTHASGAYSHAEGTYTYATTTNAHAEGSFTHAEGEAAHAEGLEAYVTGEAAHAEGEFTHADGEAAHAEGRGAYATGNYSHAGGDYTIADQESQTAIGKYNDNTTATSALFVVGNGTSDTDRKNAFTVNKDGTATLAKVGENDNNIATVGYLNAQLNALITVADIDTICGGNIVAASEVTF